MGSFAVFSRFFPQEESGRRLELEERCLQLEEKVPRTNKNSLKGFQTVVRL